MTAFGRLCCKSLKTPGDKFPARSRNKPRSLIDVASGSLPKSPVNLSPCDEVPHMFTAKAASTARKICDQRCKKTFTTQSAQSGRRRPNASAFAARLDRQVSLLIGKLKRLAP